MRKLIEAIKRALEEDAVDQVQLLSDYLDKLGFVEENDYFARKNARLYVTDETMTLVYNNEKYEYDIVDDLQIGRAFKEIEKVLGITKEK